MPEMFPFFLGITGKRSFSDDERAAARIEDDVRDRLAKVFAYLDKELPGTPKILLTGAAAGADLIAAEEILFPKNPRRAAADWLVVAVLPFDQRLFEQDFTPEEWRRFKHVIDDPRTLEWVLPNLKSGKDGLPFNPGDLERSKQATEFQKDVRRRHYEQVGLWIADHANVLIGVMSKSEKAEKLGGTARIVACRRGGRPDALAAEVIAASARLMPRPDLHRPPRGFVWLIDPLERPERADLPVTILAPATDFTPDQIAYEKPGLALTPAAGDSDFDVSEKDHRDESKNLFVMAKAYMAENKPRSQRLSWNDLRTTNPGRSPAAILNRVASELNPYSPGDSYRRVMYWLVSWFLLAVLAFEIFAKFMHDKPLALSAYIVILLCVIGIYFYAELREMQAAAEDRRAVREVLRVQGAWWQAGLPDRADHHYLPGGDDDLLRVRDAARNVILWAELKGTDTGAVNWKGVFAKDGRAAFHHGMEAGDYPRDWVGNQLYYFRQRQEQRKMKGELLEIMSWQLFTTAACLALLLLWWLWETHASPGDEGGPTLFSMLRERLDPMNFACAALLTVSCVGGASVLWWAGTYLFADMRVKWRKFLLQVFVVIPAAFLIFLAALTSATIVDEKSGPATLLVVGILPTLAFAPYWVLKLLPIAGVLPRALRKWLPDANQAHPKTTAFGLGAAIMLGFVLQASAALHMREHFNFVQAATYMTIVYIIYLPALGGAMRFLSEKLAIEAEALSYRDAHCWFVHADELLSHIKPGMGNSVADAQARDVIMRLGILALEENAAWLRSRRQRPLSPL
jgi:hypothetical protein